MALKEKNGGWDGQAVRLPLGVDAGTLRSGGLDSKPAPATWPLCDLPGKWWIVLRSGEYSWLCS